MRQTPWKRLLAGFVLAIWLALPAAQAEERPAPDFAREIQPLLAAHCTKCHGPEKQTSGLRLDDGEAALAGGDSGAAILPGKAAASLLIERVTSGDDSIRMPPEGKPLTAEQIDLLRRWIDGGANWPESASTNKKPPHWSLQPIVRPAVPPIRNPQSAFRNSIDAFLLHALEAKQLQQSPPADRRTLIRRLSFDLIGLPPTPEEVAAFVADADPLAYEKLVDRLLASPRHG
jgi:hypothetical protein